MSAGEGVVTARYMREFDLLVRASLVRRYHIHTTLREDTVGRHSGMVAWLCYQLTAGEPSADLLMAALQHDVPEAKFGDIPSPVKWFISTKMLREGELAVLTDVGQPDFYGRLNAMEQAVLGVADCMEGLLFTGHELFGFGNRSIKPVHDKYMEYVEQKIAGLLSKDTQQRALLMVRGMKLYFFGLEGRDR